MKSYLIVALLISLLFISACTLGQAQLQLPQRSQPLDIIASTPEPLPAPSECVDSDDTVTYGDDSYYAQGFVITPYGVDYDLCKEKTLVERFCEYGHKKHNTVSCPHGCFDGACSLAPPAEPTTAPVI